MAPDFDSDAFDLLSKRKLAVVKAKMNIKHQGNLIINEWLEDCSSRMKTLKV